MKIYNTETKEVDTLNNVQALRVIARTDGLWVKYQESEHKPIEVQSIDLPSNSKPSVKKATRSRSNKRKPK